MANSRSRTSTRPSTPISGSPSSISLAATLPPELLSLIFSLTDTIDTQLTPKNGKDLSLVCRAWSGAGQRYLYSCVLISKASDLDSLRTQVEQYPRLASYITKLDVDVYRGIGSWTVEELIALLDVLPSLPSLRLYLNSRSPRADGDYSLLKDLPQLISLAIQLDSYDNTLQAPRQILKCTQNISTLVIGNDRVSTHELPPPQLLATLVPISLPRLRHLSLRGNQLVRSFEKHVLLDSKTIEHIEEITMDVCHQFHDQLSLSSPATFLSPIAPNIRTLRLTGSGKDSLDQEEVVRTCSAIGTLVVARHFRTTFVPATVKTVKYQGSHAMDCSDDVVWHLLKEGLLGKGKVGRVQVVMGTMSKEMVAFCKEMQVEVIIGGSFV